MMILRILGCALCSISLLAAASAGEQKKSPLQMALENTKPLEFEQGERAPLVLWTPDLPANANDQELMQTLKALKARGIGLMHRWPGNVQNGAQAALRIAKMQKQLGMPILVDGTGITHGFYSGDKKLSHIDAEGNRFRDKSFFWQPGCPFAVESRFDAKRKPFEDYIKAYKAAGVDIDYWMGDFEFDGPEEWNDGWATAKKCMVCRENVKNIDTDFYAFQKAVRDVRAAMQHEVWVNPLKDAFPQARIGNYAINPNDGYRYYHDFYEQIRPELPHKKMQNALYRPWVDEFSKCGYTMSMPVIYTWYRMYGEYTWENRQYRWFYPMLREASSAASQTAPDTPTIAFVHWSTTNAPAELPEGFEPLSEQNYKELLWHMLLRGVDSFAMWSPAEETAVEVRPVHQVYAESLQYADFLNKGTPVTFDVPTEPGTVVSGLKLGDKLLVRRTDFAGSKDAVRIEVGGKSVAIPAINGKCLILTIN